MLGLAASALALWIVGVRDWRVYGAAALWPQVIGEIRISHLTPVLCLLAALVWRYRSTTAAGFALGFAGAVKFFSGRSGSGSSRSGGRAPQFSGPRWRRRRSYSSYRSRASTTSCACC